MSSAITSTMCGRWAGAAAANALSAHAVTHEKISFFIGLELRAERVDELPGLGVARVTVLRPLVGDVVEQIVHVQLPSPREPADFPTVADERVHCPLILG